MILHDRRDQFSYLMGYIAKSNKGKLKSAFKILTDDGYALPEPKDVFYFCPFNDGEEQILRGYHIFENSNHEKLSLNISTLINEFIFLISDFIPPCCDDGRTFYCLISNKKICMECDRCGLLYDLDENLLIRTASKKMLKNDFLDFTGIDTDKLWPYHAKLKDLIDRIS